MRTTLAPPPSASPKARLSPQSLPSAACRTRTSISAQSLNPAIIDRAVGDAAFALKEGEVSAPVQGRFGTALARVSKIEPETVRSFEEVSPELKQDIATERAKTQTTALYDKIEDERSIGKTLAEAAEGAQARNHARSRSIAPAGIHPASRWPCPTRSVC